MTDNIHPQTSIGALHLTVSDLSRSLAYYEERIGLKLHRREGDVAYLGASKRDLLQLTELTGASLARGVTGLYHFALLVPSRLDLARVLGHLVLSKTPIGGFSDHAVSEAIYLSDPDGHGIEIYRDRPRDEWTVANGQLRIVTEPLDVDDLLAELRGEPAPSAGLPPDTVVGHMHLHVADLNASYRFYVDILGFELVARYGPSAMFVSAGGYHHHIGLNTWAGAGAPQPPGDALRLQWYEVRLPDAAALSQVIDRVKAAGHPFDKEERGISVHDPAGNKLLLTADSSNGA